MWIPLVDEHLKRLLSPNLVKQVFNHLKTLFLCFLVLVKDLMCTLGIGFTFLLYQLAKLILGHGKFFCVHLFLTSTDNSLGLGTFWTFF